MIHKIFIVILSLAGAAQAQRLEFDFGRNVTTASVYEKSATFGFEDASNVVCSSEARSCSSEKPFYFSVKVPEGNYRVTVTFGDKNAASDNTLKAELRRLMIENTSTKKGKFATVSFIVNVRRPEFPGGIVKLKEREKLLEAWAWDERLTLEFNGKRPSVSALTIEKADDLPTVFLMGDSTVCDQPGEPYASWGQMLPAFFRPEIAVANHAESGESLRSSFGAKRLDKVLSLLKRGDYVLLQFAHNDEKEKGDGVGAMTTFKASLIQYAIAIRAKGGIPVLITPMHRRTFDKDGRITNSHGEYPDAVRAAASETKTPLIDLASMSKDFYEALGREKSAAAFKEGDGTHHNNYGAYQLARMIATALTQQKSPLAKFLRKDFQVIEPKKPDAPESFRIPASPNFTNTRPLGS